MSWAPHSAEVFDSSGTKYEATAEVLRAVPPSASVESLELKLNPELAATRYTWEESGDGVNWETHDLAGPILFVPLDDGEKNGYQYRISAWQAAERIASALVSLDSSLSVWSGLTLLDAQGGTVDLTFTASNPEIGPWSYQWEKEDAAEDSSLSQEPQAQPTLLKASNAPKRESIE